MHSRIDSKYLIGADFRFEAADRSVDLSLTASVFNYASPGLMRAQSNLQTDNENVCDDTYDTLSSKVSKYLGK